MEALQSLLYLLFSLLLCVVRVSSIQVSYRPPMTLGRTYDVDTDDIGTEIFTAQQITNNMHIIPHDNTIVDTRVVKTAKDARNMLSVSGSMSLKLKMGLLNIRGYGSYLKDSSSKENTVEVAIKVTYQTELRSLTSSARPYDDWHKRQSIRGKHYVRALTYGGELLARMKFVTTSNEKKEDIQAVLSAGINVGGGILDAKVEGHFKQAMRYAASQSNVFIRVFSTAGIDKSPTDLESFLKIIENFPKQIRAEGDGKGQPISADVARLSFFDRTGTLTKLVHKSDRLKSSRFDDIEEIYDDILGANAAIELFLKGKTCNCSSERTDAWKMEVTCVPPNMLQDLASLSRELITVNRAVVQFMASFHHLEDSEIEQKMKEVQDTYYQDSTRAPVKYYRKFKKTIGEPGINALTVELLGINNYLVTNMEARIAKHSDERKDVQTLLEIKDLNNVHILTQEYVEQLRKFSLGYGQDNYLSRTKYDMKSTVKFNDPFCKTHETWCRGGLTGKGSTRGLSLLSTQFTGTKKLCYRMKGYGYSTLTVQGSKSCARPSTVPDSRTMLMNKDPDDMPGFFMEYYSITQADLHTYASMIELISLY